MPGNDEVGFTNSHTNSGLHTDSDLHDSKLPTEEATPEEPIEHLPQGAALPMVAAFASLCPPLSTAQLQQLSPTALAYLGDAVYELYIRHYYLTPPRRLNTYHQQVIAQVRAEGQVAHLRSLLGHLTPAELDIVRRGRNATTGCPKRLDRETYQHATSLETLIGYLYLTDFSRLTYLLAQLELPPA